MRRLAAAAAVALLLAAAPAVAETAADALQAFGLVGTWSPDCAGPIRVSYSLHPGAPPTSRAVINGTEQAVTEIQDAVRLAPDRLRWTSIYRKYSPLDVARQSWMPEPGETWETELLIEGGKIRSLASQRADGRKVLVRNGFYYAADDAVPGRPTVWRKTDQETPYFVRCPANPKAAAARPVP